MSDFCLLRLVGLPGIGYLALSARLRSILTHRLPAHLDAMGVVAQHLNPGFWHQPDICGTLIPDCRASTALKTRKESAIWGLLA
jgi:hypothetical protein